MPQRKDALISEVVRLADLSLPPDKFFATFFDRMIQIVDAKGGSIWLCKGDEKTLNCQMNRVPPNSGLEMLHVSALVKIIGACISGQRQIVIPPEQLIELAASPSSAFNPESLTLICVPFQGGSSRRPDELPLDSSNTTQTGSGDAQQGASPIANKETQAQLPAILGAVLVFKRLGSDPELRESSINLIQLLSAQIVAFLSQGIRLGSSSGVGATTALKIASEINSSLNPTEIAYAIVNLASDLVKYDRCCIALYNGSKLQVEAVSGQDTIQKKSALIKRLTRIMEYVSEYGKGLYVTGNLDMAFQDDPEMRENFISYFESTSTKSFVGIPLLIAGEGANRAGDPLGVLCVESAAVNAYSEDELGTIDIFARNCANALENARKYRRLPMVKTLNYLAEKRDNISHWSRKKLVGFALAASLLIFVLFFCKWDFKLGGVCRITPETRSFLVARIGNSALKNVYFHEGDFVHKGDVVAELDDNDLRLALDVAEKDYKAKCQEAIKFRGEGKIANCCIAELEAKRMQARIELLKSQLEKTKIVAISDGILLTPRLEEKIGTIMKQGEPLCAVADLNKLVLEVLVPEDEISYIKENMPVEFIMNAMPEKKWKAMTINIAEQSIVNNRKNVFVVTCHISNGEASHPSLFGEISKAEAASGIAPVHSLLLPNGDAQLEGERNAAEAEKRRAEMKNDSISRPLSPIKGTVFRPGMKGKAKIICGRRRVGYLLIRKILNFIRLHLWF